MLTKQNNELLTRTGPDTPMGRVMRCFWIPVMTLAEVPAPDEPPVRPQLLGESLIVFRDTDGRVGVLDEHCPHRGASLFFGRNEEAGIRCVYHGWKFGVDGQCVDMPTESADSPMRCKVRAKAYEAREAGGILWVYMGKPEDMPELPGFEWLGLPDSHVYVSRWEQDCNYAQAMEGELDSAHVGFLHRLVDKTDTDDRALTGRFFRDDTAPLWKIEQTPAGFMAVNGRKVEAGRYWRLNQFVLPFFTMIPPHPNDARLVRMWVPMSDERCWVLCATFRPDKPLSEAEVNAWRNGENSHRRVIPGTTRPTERLDNDYLIDRQAQKTISFTGIHGIRAQDAMVCESAGPIVDRTRENLGSSDRAVVAMRRKLLDAAIAFDTKYELPVAPSYPHLFGVRATQAVLPLDTEPLESIELMGSARPAPIPASPPTQDQKETT